VRYMIKTVVTLVALTACSHLPLVLHAEEASQNRYWPCAQILVPEIPAAVVWAGPSSDGMADVWKQDAEIASLVRRLTARDYPMESADGQIGEFAAKLSPQEKEQKLTLLFAGIHQTLNEDRGKKIDGILRYSRGQAKRADRLSGDLDEMVRLQDSDDLSPAAKERLAMMEKEMALKQRMFDERETFMQYLCSRPVVVEQKLGTLARTIAYYLD
jgi:hypothetical protein